MKLRNKKTGEIREWTMVHRGEPVFFESLAKLNDDWEDYKPAEPLKDKKIKKLLGEVVELELTVNELNKRFNEFNKHYTELCGEDEQ